MFSADDTIFPLDTTKRANANLKNREIMIHQLERRKVHLFFNMLNVSFLYNTFQHSRDFIEGSFRTIVKSKSADFLQSV